MEDNRRARECKLKRCYECSRLEDEVWKAAYEQIWPLVRRALSRRRAAAAQGGPTARQQATSVAQGA
jgi:hypothetical protein